MTNTKTTGWTLMNTSRTYTTRYGYSNTITLAGAMRNRQANVCTNLASNFASLRMAIGIAAQTKGQ